jgi:hypothetical protein
MVEIFAIAICLSDSGPCRLLDESQAFFHIEDCQRARRMKPDEIGGGRTVCVKKTLSGWEPVPDDFGLRRNF